MSALEQYQNEIEATFCLFTIEYSKIKVLLLHKTDDPYRGYWMLPSMRLSKFQTLEEGMQELIEDLGIPEVELHQGKLFSQVDRMPNERVLGVSFYAAIDSKMFELKEMMEVDHSWFEVTLLPKMIYDHSSMVLSCLEELKHQLLATNLMKELFPSDFTLPEVQTVYEFILGKEMDRRNFRKKLVQAELLEDTGDKNDALNGRPAKLYRFKDDANVANLFFMR